VRKTNRAYLKKSIFILHEANFRLNFFVFYSYIYQELFKVILISIGVYVVK